MPFILLLEMAMQYKKTLHEERLLSNSNSNSLLQPDRPTIPITSIYGHTHAWQLAQIALVHMSLLVPVGVAHLGAAPEATPAQVHLQYR